MEAGSNNTSQQTHFNEAQWLKLLFLLADTQEWINEMNGELFSQLPVANKKKFLKKNYSLSTIALAHIIERHYYKILRYPGTGKFHVPLPEILHYIREAASLPAMQMQGSANFKRTIQAEKFIGFDKNGNEANSITIITDSAGRIVTAYPDNFIGYSAPDPDLNILKEEQASYYTISVACMVPGSYHNN